MDTEGKIMPTFMTQPTFDTLALARKQIAKKTPGGTVGPSYIFVPWAGEHLKRTGQGIYYVGIATDSEEAGTDEPTFAVNLSGTEKFCHQPTRGGSPYWQFLNRLTFELLGGPYDRTQHLWGWSNLLKIAGTKGPPGNWPAALIAMQREACLAAFREEISKLRNSLIVVTSENEYGILLDVAGSRELWNTTPRESQIFFRHDPVTGNTFVHAYHPKYMRQRNFFEAAVADTIRVARETLPTFER